MTFNEAMKREVKIHVDELDRLFGLYGEQSSELPVVFIDTKYMLKLFRESTFLQAMFGLCALEGVKNYGKQ